MSIELSSDFRRITSRAIKAWGHASQRMMMIEECSELIQVLAKVGRKIHGATVENIIEEMVDVELMLGQMKVVYEGKMWTEIRDEKLKRLEERLKE